MKWLKNYFGVEENGAEELSSLRICSTPQFTPPQLLLNVSSFIIF